MKNRYVLLADLPLIAIATVGAFAARFDWLFYRERPEFLTFLVAALLIKPVLYHFFGMYRRYWRYASVQELLVIVVAVSAASVAMGVFVQAGTFFEWIGGVSRVVLLTDWLLTLVLCGGLRFMVRVTNESSWSIRPAPAADASRRMLVVGAGAAGTLVAREMRRNPQLGQTPVGFLDDDTSKVGKYIAGLRVLGTTDDLRKVVAAHKIDTVVIAMPTVRGGVVRRIVDVCAQLGVKSQTIPGVFELLDGDVSISRLRTVEITDLLRRGHLVGTQTVTAASYLTGATVLVTGAGGSIGQELSRQVAHAGPRHLILLGHGENSIFEADNYLRLHHPGTKITAVIADIRDERRIERVFEEFRPEIVFHAAAHKHVPLMEENAVEAVANNVLGTHIVATAAMRHGARRFVLISTDKAVAPTSIMGASKRVAEMVVRSLAGTGRTMFVAVRFGNVLGSRGSVVPLFKAQIERGGPVTITDPEMKRFFMTIPEAVHLVLRAGGLATGGELFVLNMGQPVKIKDLAEDLIKLSGYTLSEIPIVYTSLRPGEKLEELLWEPDARVQPTDEPDILRVQEVDAGGTDVTTLVRGFREAVAAGDRFSVEAALAQAIPSYSPSLTRSFAGAPDHFKS